MVITHYLLRKINSHPCQTEWLKITPKIVKMIWLLYHGYFYQYLAILAPLILFSALHTFFKMQFPTKNSTFGPECQEVESDISVWWKFVENPENYCRADAYYSLLAPLPYWCSTWRIHHEIHHQIELRFLFIKFSFATTFLFVS